MIKKFSFDKVREDVRNKDVLVIQGYTNEAFLHSNSIEVSFVSGSRREKVVADTVTEKLMPVFAVVRGGYREEGRHHRCVRLGSRCRRSKDRTL